MPGTRIQFTGSASAETNPETLRYAQELLRKLSKRIVSEGGGLVVGLGSEPTHERHSNLPTTFDWTVIEGFIEGVKIGEKKWPRAAGQPLVAIGFANWKERIPKNRRELWTQAVETDGVRIVQLPEDFNIGGVMREVQSSFADILFVVGGAPGAHHLASLYLSQHKPVVPLDIPLGPTSGGQREGEKLASAAMKNPSRFFQFEGAGDASAVYSTLSFKDAIPPLKRVESSIMSFVSQMKPPQAFLARLQDRDNSEFDEVDSFFRDIVAPVISRMEYTSFEVGTNISSDQFLNVEIFRQIDLSSLIMVDLTGLRSNCFMELGYAFGIGRKVIVSSRKGVPLPFDVSAVPCYRWDPKKSASESRSRLIDFMNVNIGRGPLVREQSFFDLPLR